MRQNKNSGKGPGRRTNTSGRNTGKSDGYSGGKSFGRSDKPKDGGSGYDKPRRTFGASDSTRNYDRKPRSFDKPVRDNDSRPPKRGGFGGKRTFTEGSDRPKRNYGDSSERPKRSYGAGSDRPKRNYSEGSDRPKRSFGEGSDRPKRTYSDNSDRPKRNYGSGGFDRPKRSYGEGSDRPKRNYSDNSDRPKRSYGSGAERPKRSYGEGSDRPKRNFTDSGSRGGSGKSNYGSNSGTGGYGSRSTGNRFEKGGSRGGSFSKPGSGFKKRDEAGDRPTRKPLTSFKDDFRKKGSRTGGNRTGRNTNDGPPEETYLGKFFKLKEDKNPDKPVRRKSFKEIPTDEKIETEIRLNRYIANSGVCSRREADELIAAGDISVNGQKITELGYKVKPGDTVKYGSRILSREALRYVLINKPKDFITTTEDPGERKTVMELVKTACKERIYPVGRLDRNTTGLLLLTNDGELAQKLTHPSFNVKKIYAVELNRPISPEDAAEILDGLFLEEGKAVVDSLAILDETRKSVGIELHIGWNHVVRRIFAAKGYDVVKLDRVMYAGLTKKDLPRGHWRHLSEKEIITMKHLI